MRKLDLTEILMLVSGMFLFAAALWNLSELKGGFDAFPFILGILALLGALIALANVIMPALLKQLDGEVMNIMMLVFAAIFILWGLVVTFTWDFGSLGEFVCVGGIGLLMAGLLRMGILK